MRTALKIGFEGRIWMMHWEGEDCIVTGIEPIPNRAGYYVVTAATETKGIVNAVVTGSKRVWQTNESIIERAEGENACHTLQS